MYSIDIIKSSINLYFKLKKDNIVGKKKINELLELERKKEDKKAHNS